MNEIIHTFCQSPGPTPTTAPVKTSTRRRGDLVQRPAKRPAKPVLPKSNSLPKVPKSIPDLSSCSPVPVTTGLAKMHNVFT